MEEIVTSDLSQFGRRELALAGELLSALHTVRDNTKFLGDGVKVYMNKSSGYVFLSDEDYNTAMMNGNVLEDFINCPECGFEALSSEFSQSDDAKDCCKEHAREIQL